MVVYGIVAQEQGTTLKVTQETKVHEVVAQVSFSFLPDSTIQILTSVIIFIIFPCGLLHDFYYFSEIFQKCLTE